MATQHPLSTCCQAGIIRYGTRRRQCKMCRRTWRIHKHKRGRDPRRYSRSILTAIFIYNRPIKQLTPHYPELSVSALRKRARRLIEKLATSSRQYPEKLAAPILVVDGIWYTFKSERYVLFLFLLKPPHGQAIILDPVMLPGKESDENWSRALATIPSHLRKGITIMVSDNFRSATTIARRRGWDHQLCHFHLLAELKRKRGRRKKTLSARALREEAYQIITSVLFVLEENQVPQLITRLKELAADPTCPTRFSFTLREFVRRHRLYRTYLQYPELPIPTTTNAVESLNKLIRQHTRFLRTPHAVLLWATAFVRIKKTITCNGANQIK